MTIPRLAAALALPLLAVLLASCNGAASSASGTAPALRVANLAFNAPYNFDVLEGGATIATNLAYGQATAFQAIAAGSLTVKFEPTGTTTVSLNLGVAAANGIKYSIIAVQGTAGLSYLSVAQSEATPNAGQSQISLVNAAPAAGALDFYITTPTAALPLTPTLANVAYAGDGGSVAPVPQPLASGDYRIRAVKNGDSTQAIVFDSGPVTFVAGATPLLVFGPVTGSASTVAITSLGGDNVVTTIADQRVQLRVGNFAPATNTVDTYFDQNGAGNTATSLFQTGVGQGAVGAYQVLLPGAYHASFTNSGQTTELIGSDLALAAGTSVSVFAVGVPGQIGTKNLKLTAVRDDLRAPPTGMAKLRLVFAAPDLTTSIDLVTLVTTNGTTSVGQRIIVSLPYAGASPYATLAAGSYSLAVVPTGTDTPVLPASAGTPVTLAANTVTTLIFAGCQLPGSGICAAAAAPLQFVQRTD